MISLNGRFTKMKTEPISQADGLTDSQLLERTSRGDSDAFERLFHRHYSKLYGLVFRLVGNRDEAEDIVQDVFIKLHQRPPSRSKSSLGDQGQEAHNVGAWLYRVATNTAYNTIRARQRLWERNRVLVQDERDRPDGPEKLAESGDDVRRVRSALARLSPQQGQLLLLRQLGLSYAELAEACEINPNSVGKTLSRAADAFRKAYEEVAG